MKNLLYLCFDPEWTRKSAWIGHLPFAAWMIKEFKPTIFVELGTMYGTSYFAFCQAVKEVELNTKCFAIDTWKGDIHSGLYGHSVYSSVCAENEKYSKFSTLIKLRFDEALSNFQDGSVDLLHIDGQHDYESVFHNFKSWKPKLSSRAIVLFHDTEVRDKNFGVYRLWNQLVTHYPSFSFLHCHGLGVLFVGLKIDSYLSTMLLTSENSDQIRSFFAFTGGKLEESSPSSLIKYLQLIIKISIETLRRRFS